MFNQKSTLSINILKLKNIKDNDENEILSTSLCRETRHIIIDDYETINDKYININNQLFV